MLTQEYLKSIIFYDPNTGIFTWSVTKSATSVAGYIAGNTNTDGYIRITIDGKKYAAHILAWLYVHGVMPIAILDHKNQNRQDNKISNLRPSDCSNNGLNRSKPRPRTKTGLLGVSCARGKYQANLQVRKQRIFLGEYMAAEDAATAYWEFKDLVIAEIADLEFKQLTRS